MPNSNITLKQDDIDYRDKLEMCDTKFVPGLLIGDQLKVHHQTCQWTDTNDNAAFFLPNKDIFKVIVEYNIILHIMPFFLSNTNARAV